MPTATTTTRHVHTARAIKALTLAALLMAAAAAGTGAVSPPGAAAQVKTAPAQVKTVADVKTLLKPELPAGAVEIPAAMTSAKVGDTITVRGNVALSKDAFAADAASFTIVDESARAGTPPAADALPDTAEAIPAAARATVQVLDAGSTPLRATLANQHGLKPGAEVFVTGKVTTANGTDRLVIAAVSMHVPKAPLPIGFFVDTPPENIKDVSAARKAGGIKAGDEVVLRGRIGGSKEPFVPGRAVFTIVGRGLKACNENPGDKCAKPWDYCCDTKEEILANSATVQVVDGKGQILRTDMKGRRGLKELSEVTVVGKVASADGKAVVINATAIHAAR